jgi:hypothetical protein
LSRWRAPPPEEQPRSPGSPRRFWLRDRSLLQTPAWPSQPAKPDRLSPKIRLTRAGHLLRPAPARLRLGKSAESRAPAFPEHCHDPPPRFLQKRMGIPRTPSQWMSPLTALPASRPCLKQPPRPTLHRTMLRGRGRKRLPPNPAKPKPKAAGSYRNRCWRDSAPAPDSTLIMVVPAASRRTPPPQVTQKIRSPGSGCP